MFHSTGLTVLLTLGFLAEWVFAAPTFARRSNESISWGACESFGVNTTGITTQCGYLDVPMDYHDSSVGNARLAVIKLAATPGKKVGTLFFNPGGPGGSGLESISVYGLAFTQAFQGAFDLIAWDPRGVGYTFPGPVHCFNSTEEDAVFWNYTPASINETISGKFNEQDFKELYSKAPLTEQKFNDFNARCLNSSSGPYLKYIGTSSAVRDLVSVGDAILGEGERMNYWGISYGTFLGFNFVNMFPERAGSVILDGIVDPTAWLTYKFMHTSLTDTEKTYSGLTDGCAKAGRAGCKLIEITGDNASGDDVKALLNYAHDVSLELYRAGYEVPVPPGYLKSWLYTVLYSPETWSQYVNADIYQFVALVLQAAQAHDITIDGGHNYNVPSGNITIAQPFMGLSNAPPTLTDYTSVAIGGSDDFNDTNVRIEELFDVIVENTRELTPTFGSVWTMGYNSYRWPVRSVERVPPFNPTALKTPVLVIGNSADPITPFESAEKVAGMFGENAFLLEQLGFGHTSIAQVSACTRAVVANYLANATLPQGNTTQCAVDEPNLFPPLNQTTTVTRRSNVLRRWW